jgi:hypothetical protein
MTITNWPLLLRLFLFALVLLTVLDSIQAQTAKSAVALRDLGSAAKSDDAILARRAVVALEQLRAAVLVYRSYDAFESDRRVARVPLEIFTSKLNQVTAEVESILLQLSNEKLRGHLRNSLYAYRDGAFWWAKLGQQKVLTIASLRVGFTSTTPAETFLNSTAPYTVVIHWRQADKYLLSAQRLIVEANRNLSERAGSIASAS